MYGVGSVGVTSRLGDWSRDGEVELGVGVEKPNASSVRKVHVRLVAPGRQSPEDSVSLVVRRSAKPPTGVDDTTAGQRHVLEPGAEDAVGTGTVDSLNVDVSRSREPAEREGQEFDLRTTGYWIVNDPGPATGVIGVNPERVDDRCVGGVDLQRRVEGQVDFSDMTLVCCLGGAVPGRDAQHRDQNHCEELTHDTLLLVIKRMLICLKSYHIMYLKSMSFGNVYTHMVWQILLCKECYFFAKW